MRAALVTGGTGAVGSAVCRLLSANGHDIAFAYRSNEAARDRVAECVEAEGQRVLARSVDLADPEQAARFVKEVAAEFGGIDTLIHAGGPHVPQRYISQVDANQFSIQVDNEVKAFFNLVRPALEHLRASQGSIVAVTTVAIRKFPLRDGLSSGPKAGIEALVRAIAAEEGKYSVRANCVAPGILDDGMAAELRSHGDFDDSVRNEVLQRIPLRRFGKGADVAEAVCFLASDKASYITGQSVDVDGGYAL